MSEVFISYAHPDDQPLAEGARGWVTALADRLQKSLAMKRGGGQVTVWMDHRLEPQKQVDGALAERVGRADCFVAILSPRYLESHWCRSEIDGFLRRAGDSSGRVFLVELAPTLRDEWPAGVRNLSTLKFWAQAFDDPVAIPLGWPAPDPAGDRPYWRALNELSHFVSDQLQALSPTVAVSACKVWIADPTDHVLEYWEHLAGALRQQHCRVLPASPGQYPSGTETAFRLALETKLQHADILVQLFGPHPGRRPGWAATPYTLLAGRAASAAAAERGLPLLTWRSADVKLEAIADSGYAELVTGAASGGFEEFQQSVLDRAAGAAPAAATVAAAIDSVDAPLNICVSADAPDRTFGQQVRDMLFSLGVDASLAPEPAPHQSPAQWRHDYEAMLGESHGVVIVYGATPASWVQAQVQAARKLLARTRRGTWGALLDGPPGQQPDHGVRSHNLMMIDCRRGLAAEPLSRFVTSLRSAGV